MIEPLSVIAAIKVCSTAVKQVKNLCEQGAELHQCSKQIASFFGAKQDIEKAKKQAENPPIWKKVLKPHSAQAEAIEAVIQRKQALKLMGDLHRTLKMRFGADIWTEVVAEQRKIEAERERIYYKRKELVRKWTEGILVVFACFLSVGLILLIIYIVMNRE